MQSSLPPPSPDSERQVLDATRPFAQPELAVAVAQIVSTVGLFALLVWALASWATPLTGLLASPFLAALVVRAFVLQHDAGHRSLLPGTRANDRVGAMLSVLSGMPFRAWRDEHAWHHAHQGKLHLRGVDMVNSPMTAAEARQDPDAARARAERIRPRTVLLLGAIAVLILRKTTDDFFMFRESFPHRVADPDGIRRSVRLGVAAHLGLHAVLAWLVGPLVWLPTALLGWGLAGMVGALLFWIQHNVEHTWHAGPEAWSAVRVALRGSSYLALPAPLAWATAHIGLHHVHHLNSRIPNHRLEAARQAIPELAAVAPLSLDDVRRSVTHVFWDEEALRMVTLDEVQR